MTLFTTHPVPGARLHAVQALLVYEDRSRQFDSARYALTTHEIDHTAGGVHIGAGRLLGAQDQQALLDILLGMLAADSGFLPAEVISHSAAQIAWTVPGRVRRMWFRLDEDSRAFDVPWPTLLFCVTQGRLRLAALARSARPCPDTPVHHAPLMNVHADTALCTGNAALPHGWSLGQRAGYEAVVYDTNFNHVNHDHTLRLPGTRNVTTAQHLRFWRDLHAARGKRFPSRALVPLNMTVSQWLTRS